MAKRKHHPGHNLGRYLHPAKGKNHMATPPVSAASAAPSDDDAMSAAAPADPTASAGGDDSGSDESDNVLCTILKNSDGTYTLIDGDEDDGDTSDGSSDGGGGDMAGDEAGQQFDSKGALLKAVLDLLNEDESSEGGEGSADDQLNAGYNENAPTPVNTTVNQKY